MKKSLLGAVALGVGGAAVAGFGASAGRDFYRSVKKSIGGLFVLVAVAGAVFSPVPGDAQPIARIRSGEWWKSIGEILLVPAGMGLGIGVAMFAGLMGLELMTMSFVIISGRVHSCSSYRHPRGAGSATSREATLRDRIA